MARPIRVSMDARVRGHDAWNSISHARQAYDHSQMEKKPPGTRPAAFSEMRRKQRTRA
ncbi:hypothetical protein GTP55_02555 [Duganella sp. FT109W]|uniref:Uncharacterized protein n=1 Tax=Duganella margarita TaxID=2692170 RepID=A0ABW9WBD7_9BURK|nr:hypothetical protein [Duganella margarita]MYN38244.1 hypothetical protein [Duganella margarita]